MKVIDLDLLKYQSHLIIREDGDKKQVFDPIRSKYIWLGPEEHVRQLLIHYLIKNKNISKNRIAVEKQFILNDLKKRFDIVIYDDKIQPLCIIECKAHSHKITQNDIDQLTIYNIQLKGYYILISNGNDSYFWSVNPLNGKLVNLNSFVLEHKQLC